MGKLILPITRIHNSCGKNIAPIWSAVIVARAKSFREKAVICVSHPIAVSPWTFLHSLAAPPAGSPLYTGKQATAGF